MKNLLEELCELLQARVAIFRGYQFQRLVEQRQLANILDVKVQVTI